MLSHTDMEMIDRCEGSFHYTHSTLTIQGYMGKQRGWMRRQRRETANWHLYCCFHGKEWVRQGNTANEI